ncbi:GDSL esterase/lipase [Camellia lanceoleosa]|uniref:GDSL esterase/lipase n=1 Tax=Camellia lanceoleosa TaxID=1840588 RepID=A0ACC0HX70_9ERIC|nr:GDSL esterase/lipase [Camellia lanceoleosa]
MVLSVNIAAMDVTSFQPCNFSTIYNFGDSNSDTGTLSAAFYPIPPPNGQTFFKMPVGRVSDGRLIIDFIAEHLKLPHLSAYMDSVEADFKHGAINRGNLCQLDGDLLATWCKVDISTLPNPKDFSNALYMINIGHNDLSVGFRRLSNEQFRNTTLSTMAQNVTDYVQALYRMGARTFWIQNAHPIGCFPNSTLSINNRKSGFLDQNGCIKSQNDIAMELNKQIKDKVIKLRTQLADAVLTYVDVYTAEYDLISNAKSQGFTDPMKICCGIYKNGVYVQCGKKENINGKEVYAGSCENPSTYISWDGIHHTEAANYWIANRIINGSLSDPPIPITRACHK